MLDRMTDTIDFHGKALQLRARRQEVLSSNIANADTPGFKARDFDFASALRNAAGATGSASAAVAAPSPVGAGTPRMLASADAGGAQAQTVGMSRSNPGHLPLGHTGTTLGSTAVEHTTRLKYTAPEQASMDGNSVDLNRERANFADNSIRYEATLRFINSRVRSMMTAIRGE